MLEAFHVVLGAFEKSSIIHKLRIDKQLTAWSFVSGIGILNCQIGPRPSTCLSVSSAGSSV
jgi:hypothetical protein